MTDAWRDEEWDAAGPPRHAPSDEALIVDVGGFEGPLDLLLALARDQKVDLARISVLALAEQYLAFVERARRLRLELAADYLVMAAWLAWLKSRLLLPEEAAADEPSGEEMAAALAFRLRRLEAMRQAAARLMNRSRLGRDVFARGQPEPLRLTRQADWQDGIYDLLQAYAGLRQRQFSRFVRVARRKVVSLKEAREMLMRLVGETAAWMPLDSCLSDWLATPAMRASARASALAASLELVREGEVELSQAAAFAPLYLRRRQAAAADYDEAANG
jgi:segregation and condensation protein A